MAQDIRGVANDNLDVDVNLRHAWQALEGPCKRE